MIKKKYLRINVQGLEAAASLYTRRKKMRKSAIWLPNDSLAMKKSGGIRVLVFSKLIVMHTYVFFIAPCNNVNVQNFKTVKTTMKT